MLSGDTLDLPHPLLLTSSTAPLGYVQSFHEDVGSGSLSLCNTPPAITLGTSVSIEMLLPTSWPDRHPPTISSSTRPQPLISTTVTLDPDSPKVLPLCKYLLQTS